MITSELGSDGLRDCFRDPIPEIFEAAMLLDEAVSAHLVGDALRAEAALRAADMRVLGEWLDPIWLGNNNEIRAIRPVPGLPPVLPKEARFAPRDPKPEMKRALVERDGFHCRLCGIPVVRPEVRKILTKLYPEAARWTGRKATEQHRGLQVLWLQYDHVVVWSRGGETTMENLVVTCPACNFGRDKYMMSEVGLRDPRTHPRAPYWEGRDGWEGLERILPEQQRFQHGPDFNRATVEAIGGSDLDALRKRILGTPLLASDGSHSARLWRVAENLIEAARETSPNDALLHLMSRVGVFCRGLAEDLQAGRVSEADAAKLLDQLADVGDLGFRRWLR